MPDSTSSQGQLNALSALDSLFWGRFRNCWPADGFARVREAPLEKKGGILQAHFRKWAGALAAGLEEFVPKYARLKQSRSSADPIGDAIKHLRQLLEPEVGHEPQRKTDGYSGGPESVGEWWTGGQAPAPRLVQRVAEVAAGEGASLNQLTYDDQGNELTEMDADVDKQLADEWQAPGWLHYEIKLDPESHAWKPEPSSKPSERLDARQTRTQVALIQKHVWGTLEGGLRSGALGATVDLDIRPALPEFKVLGEDYAKVQLNGKEFNLTKPQARMVGALHAELQRGGSGMLSTSALNKKAGRSPKARISDAFRSLPNWQELITSPEKGRYRLNVSSSPTDTK